MSDILLAETFGPRGGRSWGSLVRLYPPLSSFRVRRAIDFPLKHLLVPSTVYHVEEVSTYISRDCDWGTRGDLLFHRFLCEHGRTHGPGCARDCAESGCDSSEAETFPGAETKHRFRGGTATTDTQRFIF